MRQGLTRAVSLTGTSSVGPVGRGVGCLGGWKAPGSAGHAGTCWRRRACHERTKAMAEGHKTHQRAHKQASKQMQVATPSGPQAYREHSEEQGPWPLAKSTGAGQGKAFAPAAPSTEGGSRRTIYFSA